MTNEETGESRSGEVSVNHPLSLFGMKLYQNSTGWAAQAWGSYWSWDPRETWALITWIIYAIYLHLRISRGWKGKSAAIFAVAGFICVIFTYIGVNTLLPGVHSYA